MRCIWKTTGSQKRRGESVMVRNGVDVLMSRNKHTIPHAQSSPCVNLSIGARARQVQDGTGRGGAKDRKQDRERHKRAWDSSQRGHSEKPDTSVSSAFWLLFAPSWDEMQTRLRVALFSSIPVVFRRYGKITTAFYSQAEFVLAEKSLIFILFWHGSSVMAVWYWQWTECWNICTPFLSVFAWLWLSQSLSPNPSATHSSTHKLVSTSGEQWTWMS